MAFTSPGSPMSFTTGFQQPQNGQRQMTHANSAQAPVKRKSPFIQALESELSPFMAMGANAIVPGSGAVVGGITGALTGGGGGGKGESQQPAQNSQQAGTVGGGNNQVVKPAQLSSGSPSMGSGPLPGDDQTAGQSQGSAGGAQSNSWLQQIQQLHHQYPDEMNELMQNPQLIQGGQNALGALQQYTSMMNSQQAGQPTEASA
jgi:hypothetical protein